MLKKFRTIYWETQPYAWVAFFVLFAISESYYGYYHSHPELNAPNGTVLMWILMCIGYPIFFIYIAPWLVLIFVPLYFALQGLKYLIITMAFAYRGVIDPRAPFERTFNSFEALMWLGLGLLLTFVARKKEYALYKTHFFAVAILFAVFGASDIVEVYSGAWWSPWWLLIWKTLNAISLLTLMIWLVRKIKTSPKLT